MKKRTLKRIKKNGFTFNFIDLPGTNFFNFEIISSMGSNIERVLNKTLGINVYGMTHLIEHLSFRSTRDFSTKKVNKLLNVLGQYNAGTTHEFIKTYLSSTSVNTIEVIDLITNIAFNDLTRVTENEFNSEKQIITRELFQEYSDPDFSFFSKAMSTSFSLDNEDNVIGSNESISNLDYEDLLHVRALLLQNSDHVFNITYDSTNNISKTEIIDHILKNIESFNLLDKNSKFCEDYLKYIPELNFNSFVNKNNFKDMSHYIIFNTKDNLFLNNILCDYYNVIAGNRSLIEIMREKHNLCYSVNFDIATQSHNFCFIFECCVHKKNSKKMLNLFKNTISKICDSYTRNEHNKMIKSIQLNRALLYINQKRYQNLFSILDTDEQIYLRFKKILSKDIDEALIVMDKKLVSYEKFLSAITDIKQSVVNEEYAFVTNKKIVEKGNFSTILFFISILNLYLYNILYILK